MEATTQFSDRWGILQKMTFRFFAAYIFCYIGLQEMMEIMDALFDPLIGWVGKHMLHIGHPITIKPNGSGDTTYNYVQEFLFIMLSFITCIIWSVADRKRASYNKMLYWVQVLVRYYLAYVLAGYGFSKIFKSQFPAPDLQRLIQPYGKSSPMGLAWTFLGFSTSFNFFIGFFETIGGVLMLFRRTTLFGACIAATVVTNIVLINFCYDVPVKLFSSNLLLMTLFIIVCDGSRFFNLFFFNKPVAPADYSVVFKKKGWRITRIVVKVLFILLVVYTGYDCMNEAKRDGDNSFKPPLYGIYNVETFVFNNDTLPPLITDTTRWRRFVVAYGGAATVSLMNDKMKYYSFKPDTIHKTAILYDYRDSAVEYTLSYSRHDSTLVLQGKSEKDSLYVVMKRYNEKKFLLMNRGFHWINEYPMNR